MKKAALLIATLMALFITACQNNVEPIENTGDLNSSLFKGAVETGYAFSNTGSVEPVFDNGSKYAKYDFTLWAGKTNNAGTVSITNDDQNIYVTYNTNSSADLSQVHVYIWTDQSAIPTKRPAPGHAHYVFENLNSDSYTVTIPAVLECGSVFYISTHAALTADNPGDVDEAGIGNNDGETAYSAGNTIPSGFPNDKGAWWGYVTYTVECRTIIETPVEKSCETAFAYDGSGKGDFLKLDLNNDGRKDFNRWGWTVGPLTAGNYTFDLYAGAGQSDISKGTLVGTLKVNYNGSTYTVTYSLFPGFTMDETQLYVGNEILPRDVRGNYTVAPGQYPFIHGNLNAATSDVYTGSASGSIYVVAHATVCGKF